MTMKVAIRVLCSFALLTLMPANVLAQDSSTQDAKSRAQSGSAAQTQGAPVPESVQEVERDIEREVRRWHVGFRAGAALDPELIVIGVQSRIGPVFNRNFFFRPNVEYGFGEVTDLLAFNVEGIYRLPVSARQARWSAYVGAGPAFNFIHQNFERRQGTPRDIDFGNFEYDSAFNILAGVQFRRGTFMELRSSVYAEPAPSLRVIVGYNF
jgi:hypothetical protein